MVSVGYTSTLKLAHKTGPFFSIVSNNSSPDRILVGPEFCLHSKPLKIFQLATAMGFLHMIEGMFQKFIIVEFSLIFIQDLQSAMVRYCWGWDLGLRLR